MEEEQSRVKLSRATQSEESLREEERFLQLMDQEMRDLMAVEGDANPSSSSSVPGSPVPHELKPRSADASLSSSDRAIGITLVSRRALQRPPARPWTTGTTLGRQAAQPSVSPVMGRRVSPSPSSPPALVDDGIGAAKLVRDFAAVRKGQLTARKGETLKVLSRPSRDWFMCARGVEVGLVPSKSVFYMANSK